MTEMELEDHVNKKFEIKKRLGKGAYGIVWKAVDRKTKEVVALKKIFDAFQNQVDAQRTYREIMFLRAFGSHPNIIKLQAVIRASNNKDIYLVFDYMDTDLHKVIQGKNILKDIHKRFIMYQLLRATMYMHSGDVIHRDQKPSNILLDANCKCKIADFGLARSLIQLDEAEGSEDPPLTDYVATRWYRAPEILIGSTRYTKGIDMWSLGCILAEMLLERPLFPGTSSFKQLELIMRTLPQPSPEDVRLLICVYGGSKMFAHQAQGGGGRSQSLQEVLASAPPDAVDLVEKLLVLNPQNRLTAAEALGHTYVAKFHNLESEVSLQRPVLPPLSDNMMLSVEEYRSKLYEMASSAPQHAQSAPPSRRSGAPKPPPSPGRAAGSSKPRSHLHKHARNGLAEEKSKPGKTKSTLAPAWQDRRASLPNKRAPQESEEQGEGSSKAVVTRVTSVQAVTPAARKTSLPVLTAPPSNARSPKPTFTVTAAERAKLTRSSMSEQRASPYIQQFRNNCRRQFYNRSNLSSNPVQPTAHSPLFHLQPNSATLTFPLHKLLSQLNVAN